MSGISHYANIEADKLFVCNAPPSKQKATYSAYYRRNGRLFLKDSEGNKLEIEDCMPDTKISDIHFMIFSKR